MSNYYQPRSQGLSSLPPLLVGRKTLVAAGHVITQNLGGKKNLLGGRGGRKFYLVDATNFVNLKSSSSREKLLALSWFEVEFAVEECYTISAVF